MHQAAFQPEQIGILPSAEGGWDLFKYIKIRASREQEGRSEMFVLGQSSQCIAIYLTFIWKEQELALVAKRSTTISIYSQPVCVCQGWKLGLCLHTYNIYPKLDSYQAILLKL